MPRTIAPSLLETITLSNEERAANGEMEKPMPKLTRRDILAGGALTALSQFSMMGGALADAPPTYSSNEIVDSGHRFFGAVSRGLAEVVQEAGRRWGQPNGYVLGQEASAAFVG